MSLILIGPAEYAVWVGRIVATVMTGFLIAYVRGSAPGRPARIQRRALV